jgi:DNA recombination-dependent growth factor C
MGILSGAMTVRRFRVSGDVPEGFRDLYRDQLEAFAFRDPPNEMGKEEVEGWVQVHNLLDATFVNLDKWLYNDLAVFALRVDKKSLPAKLFSATMQRRCEQWCAEHDVQRCPSVIKQELKDALEQEWLRRSLPRVAVTECCWNLTARYLVLGSLSETGGDRFRKRFHRTFGLELVPWSPLDWLPDRRRVEDLLASGPADLYAEAS